MHPAPASAAPVPALPANPIQRAFWQAITVGELDTIQVLLTCRRRDIDVNKVDEFGDQRQGCTALHLAVLEMPTWKVSSGVLDPAAPATSAAVLRNPPPPLGIQSADFVRRFFELLLSEGADIHRACMYAGEWYLQTAAGKTKSFYPEGYDALGLVLQFVEITRGADVISMNVTRRLELIRDLLLEHIKLLSPPPPLFFIGTRSAKGGAAVCNTLVEDLAIAQRDGVLQDVCLICEKQRFPAHKLVLAARSPVFAAMFRAGNFAESRMDPCEVEIRDADAAALGEFVRFLYLDTLPSEMDFFLCQELLVLGNRYQIGSLTEVCARHILTHHLTVEQAPSILKLAVDNHVALLREETVRFMSRPGNLSLVLETREFQELNSALVQEVLRNVAATQVCASPAQTCTTASKRARISRAAAAISEEEEEVVVVVHAPPAPAQQQLEE